MGRTAESRRLGDCRAGCSRALEERTRVLEISRERGESRSDSGGEEMKRRHYVIT